MHYASVLIVSDQDFTDFHIVKERIDTNINAIPSCAASLLSMRTKPYSIDVTIRCLRWTLRLTPFYHGGAREDRTPDLLRARQALSQLSYGPENSQKTKAETVKINTGAIRRLSFACSVALLLSSCFSRWWVWEDLNLRPHPYQGCALTN